MVEKIENPDKAPVDPEKAQILQEIRGGTEGVLEMTPEELEVLKNFDEGEFGQYFLPSYGVESFADIVTDEADASRFLEELTFTEEDNPDASLLWHLEDDEIRLMLTMIASRQPEAFLSAIKDHDFPEIDQEVIKKAITIARKKVEIE